MNTFAGVDDFPVQNVNYTSFINIYTDFSNLHNFGTKT